MRELTELLADLEPREILQTMLPTIQAALAHLDEEERQQWLARFLSDEGDDKLVGMVNL